MAFLQRFLCKKGRELLKLTFSVLFSEFFFEVSEKISIFTLSFRNLSL